MPSSNPAQGPKQSHRGRKRSLCIYSDLHEGSIQVETMVPSKSLPLAALALFLFSISLSAAAGGDRIPAVVEALSDSGYAAMSLTIHLIADSITNFTSTFTIFTPPDSAFEAFGQPSLPHLLLHFAPISLSSTSLRSLPYGSEIPTLTSSSPLYVTTSRPDGSTVSINGVNISGSPIFDDGSVVVFPIDDFFRPNFSLQIAGEPSSCSNPRPRCKLQPFSQLQDASAALKSRGYLIMASFLDLQISGFLNPSPLKLTVFAPVDEALVMYSGDVLMYQSLFMRHILPCVLPWAELSELGKGAGTVFKDNGNGFTINIASDNGLVFVNRVKISFPDMFTNDWIVIHGLHDMIDLPEETNMGREDSAMGSESKIQESISPDRSEF